MLQVTVLCVGNLKEEHWRKACAEYEKRLRGFCRLQIIEFPECRLPENPTQGQIAAALKKEGAALMKKIPPNSLTVPLCIEGKQADSRSFAKKLEQIPVQGKSGVCFLIGSSHGLDDVVKQNGWQFSMSDMTFPHQLARVMLLEQIYRAFQISSGGKYHK